MIIQADIGCLRLGSFNTTMRSKNQNDVLTATMKAEIAWLLVRGIRWDVDPVDTVPSVAFLFGKAQGGGMFSPSCTL